MKLTAMVFASVLAACTLVESPVQADEQPAKKETKKTANEGAKEVGNAVGTAAREIGQGTKTVTREVGHATRDAAKATGHAFRDGAKEFKKAISGEGDPPKKNSTDKAEAGGPRK